AGSSISDGVSTVVSSAVPSIAILVLLEHQHKLIGIVGGDDRQILETDRPFSLVEERHRVSGEALQKHSRFFEDAVGDTPADLLLKQPPYARNLAFRFARVAVSAVLLSLAGSPWVEMILLHYEAMIGWVAKMNAPRYRAVHSGCSSVVQSACLGRR